MPPLPFYLKKILDRVGVVDRRNRDTNFGMACWQLCIKYTNLCACAPFHEYVPRARHVDSNNEAGIATLTAMFPLLCNMDSNARSTCGIGEAPDHRQECTGTHLHTRRVPPLLPSVRKVSLSSNSGGRMVTFVNVFANWAEVLHLVLCLVGCRGHRCWLTLPLLRDTEAHSGRIGFP